MHSAAADKSSNWFYGFIGVINNREEE